MCLWKCHKVVLLDHCGWWGQEGIEEMRMKRQAGSKAFTSYRFFKAFGFYKCNGMLRKCSGLESDVSKCDFNSV